MRTTLAIDDDVLAAAKVIARQRQTTVGDVISELARRSLERTRPARERNGIPLLASHCGSDAVTLDMVNVLRDEIA